MPKHIYNVDGDLYASSITPEMLAEFAARPPKPVCRPYKPHWLKRLKWWFQGLFSKPIKLELYQAPEIIDTDSRSTPENRLVGVRLHNPNGPYPRSWASMEAMKHHD